MAARNFLCPGYRKRLKLTYGLTKYMNMYTSHQDFPIRIQLEQNIEIPKKEANFGPHDDEKSTLE